MRPTMARFAGIAVWCAAAVVFAEGVSQVWVRQFVRRGKLFRPDSTLGWRPLARLDLQRRNGNGSLWRVQTDSDGWRQPARLATTNPQTRVLVLGDSYVFGEGVNVEDRFDVVAGRRRPEWDFINRGVMGFGTDQELLASEPNALRPGDLELLVTYQNDMIDVVRSGFAGRTKPFYDLSAAGLVFRPARVTWKERLRDKSYLAALFFARRERLPEQYSPEEWRHGVAVYNALVAREAAKLRDRGVTLMVLHHGDSLLSRASGLERPYAALDTMSGLRVFPLDSALRVCTGALVFLRDGHWGPDGHRCVGERLRRLLGDSSGH
jgi:hypothetical protein